MNQQQLWEDVSSLMNTETHEEFNRILNRQPELLNQEVMRAISHRVADARERGDIDVATSFARLALILESFARNRISQTAKNEREPGTNNEIVEPSTNSRPALWARLMRDYLSQREGEILDKALSAAQHTDEFDVVKLLQLYRAKNIAQIDALGARLFRSFLTAQRLEEAFTTSLVGLDLRAELATLFIHFPTERQPEMFSIGLDASQRAADFARALGDSPCRARYLTLQGDGYARAGDLFASEVAYQEAVLNYEAVAKDQVFLHQAQFAKVLYSLGDVREKLNKPSDAEGVLEQALAKYRTLAEEEPQFYEPLVAVTLMSIGITRHKLQKLDEAQEAYEEALLKFQAVDDKDPRAYEVGLATTLFNYSQVLKDLDRLGEAEAALRLALQKYRALDEKELKQAHGTTLTTLGNLLQESGNLNEAEEVFEEALTVYRALDETHLNLYKENVADILSVLGVIRQKLHKFDGAQRILEEALSRYRTLAEKYPKKHNYDIAHALNSLAIVLRQSGNLSEARVALEEALSKYEESSQIDHQRSGVQLVLTLNNLGVLWADQHAWRQAEAVFERALSKVRTLLEQDLALKSELAQTLTHLGTARIHLNKEEEAREALEEALLLRRDLLAEKPLGYEQKADLAATTYNFGHLHRSVGKPTEAEAMFEEAVVAFRFLSLQEPERYDRELAKMLVELGNVRKQIGKSLEADLAYEESLKIIRNRKMAKEGADVLSNLAETAVRQKRWARGEELLREAIESRERLKPPRSNFLRRGSMMSENSDLYERLLICLLKQGKKDEALAVAEQRKSLTIIDLLNARDSRPKSEEPDD